MKINPQMFRGYDLRGVVNVDLNPEIVEQLGKAFGTFLKRLGQNKAVVGRDCRATSPAYSQAMIKGLNWAGINTIDIGMNLVGTFYWSQYHLDCPGGVFVTASHNPAEYNGFKFANGFSETLVSEGIQKLRSMVEAEDYEEATTSGESKIKNIRQDYFNDLIGRLPLAKKFKVVVDASKATAGQIVPEFLRLAGCEVIEKNCEIDPAFPLGTPDPTEMEVAERLRREVLEAGADLGFSYDTDGDRIGVVDEKGTIIWNDILVALFAQDILREHPGAKIMYNALCSKVVPETILKNGGQPFMWQTGHSFLKKKNQEVKAAFIGEVSGHFFFSEDFYNHDDGLYSALRLLSCLAQSKQTLFEAVNILPKYILSPEIKIKCADDKKVQLIEKISPILKKDYPQAEVVDDARVGDGVRLDLPDGMLVARYSQNGPYITVRFEAKEQKLYDELKNYIRELLRKYPEVEWDKSSGNLEALD